MIASGGYHGECDLGKFNIRTGINGERENLYDDKLLAFHIEAGSDSRNCLLVDRRFCGAEPAQLHQLFHDRDRSRANAAAQGLGLPDAPLFFHKGV